MICSLSMFSQSVTVWNLSALRHVATSWLFSFEGQVPGLVNFSLRMKGAKRAFQTTSRPCSMLLPCAKFFQKTNGKRLCEPVRLYRMERNQIQSQCITFTDKEGHRSTQINTEWDRTTQNDTERHRHQGKVCHYLPRDPQRVLPMTVVQSCRPRRRSMGPQLCWLQVQRETLDFQRSPEAYRGIKPKREAKHAKTKRLWSRLVAPVAPANVWFGWQDKRSWKGLILASHSSLDSMGCFVFWRLESRTKIFPAVPHMLEKICRPTKIFPRSSQRTLATWTNTNGKKIVGSHTRSNQLRKQHQPQPHQPHQPQPHSDQPMPTYHRLGSGSGVVVVVVVSVEFMALCHGTGRGCKLPNPAQTLCDNMWQRGHMQIHAAWGVHRYGYMMIYAYIDDVKCDRFGSPFGFRKCLVKRPQPGDPKDLWASLGFPFGFEPSTRD